jgi:hypothetical protein
MDPIVSGPENNHERYSSMEIETYFPTKFPRIKIKFLLNFES